MRKVFLIVVFFLGVKVLDASVAKGDSLKNKYELNDPRNPNCPCHKYQKLAEEEFAKLNKGVAEQKITLSQNSTGFASAGTNSVNTSKTKRLKNLLFLHRKNSSYKIFNFIKRHKVGKRHSLRSNKNISSCFHWR